VPTARVARSRVVQVCGRFRVAFDMTNEYGGVSSSTQRVTVGSRTTPHVHAVVTGREERFVAAAHEPDRHDMPRTALRGIAV
jgi:hypothetical protein